MDIQIVNVIDPGDGYLYVIRTLDGIQQPNKMPKEMLAIRAAEYNLDVRDPMALDIMLLEPFMTEQDDVHPLYAEAKIEDALSIIWGRVENVRVKHGAPKEPQMRSLFHAADLRESTQGLTDTKKALLHHANPDIGTWVKMNRDTGRRQMAERPRTLTETMKLQAMMPVLDEAYNEQTRREVEASAGTAKH
jgi:hypothetical protein